MMMMMMMNNSNNETTNTQVVKPHPGATIRAIVHIGPWKPIELKQTLVCHFSKMFHACGRQIINFVSNIHHIYPSIHNVKSNRPILKPRAYIVLQVSSPSSVKQFSKASTRRKLTVPSLKWHSACSRSIWKKSATCSTLAKRKGACVSGSILRKGSMVRNAYGKKGIKNLSLLIKDKRIFVNRGTNGFSYE